MAHGSGKQDLETASLDAVLADLETDAGSGLSDGEAETRLGRYGPNALPEEKSSIFRKIAQHFIGPIAFMIEAAALVSLVLGDWGDFFIIFGLLLFNAGLEFYQDSKATSALEALKNSLAPQASVVRGGTVKTIDTARLVPGDIVRLQIGAIVPADLRLVDGNYASIDQAALTGESLPVTKKPGDLAYSGSVVKQGEMTGVVIATGAETFFGRTARLVAGAGSVSEAQKAMFHIGNFLIVLAVVLAMIMVAVQVYVDIVKSDNWGLADALAILQFVLVLLVASIPVAMPAVFSITMALGALALSRQKAIVSRLSSIDEMAGADILCSDKTGTLTKNILTLSEPIPLDGSDPAAVVLLAALASHAEGGDAIDGAVLGAVGDKAALSLYTVSKFTPFDPVSKRTEVDVTGPDGNVFSISKGAPHAIATLCKGEGAATLDGHVAALGAKGYRALAVARSDDGGASWRLAGILPMYDPPRDDSKATIDAVRAKGVTVKMITGDDTAIARETARQLGLGTNILAAADIFPKDMDPDNVPGPIANRILSADGFARVFPEHKYAIVKTFQKNGHLVAMTGDGVNDAPALKQADCGIAVSGATDAARGAAALILTAPGLSVIENAIDEARRIFGRITSYTVYRVALTMTIMFLVVLSTIFLGFQPLTPVMIVLMSLLDDIPIMTVAYDNTTVSDQPIRWRMPHLLTVSAVLGFASIVQSFGLLLMGMEVMSEPARWPGLGLVDEGHLQSMMFLALVAGGHLLLLVARTENWFIRRPYPAPPLLIAMVATQLVAVIMCGFGILVPKIPWLLIGLVWLYLIAWLFVLGVVRIAIDNMLENRSARRAMSIDVVNARLNR
ncbi:plasma-membrane proton-efflux P-type ATPase [Martelella limonii]|uniref:plasma-membrane proton-efflux P-type ATPase n=1 Tax=Martelella limonii TaxID=1647649 RepID=UPI001580BA18|nr:plasma-membrane proton-efflux P-type ATPase [Martelella limonii]